MEEENTNKGPKSFDSVYAQDDFYYGLDPISGLADFLDLNGVPDMALALDLGCGEGRDSLYMAKRGISVLAVDTSNEGIRKLQNHAKQLGLVIDARCVDARKLNIPENHFDIIVGRTFLHHLEMADIERVVKSIKDGVRVGGAVFISVFTVDDPGFGSTKGTRSECARFVRYYFNHDQLRAMFNRVISR